MTTRLLAPAFAFASSLSTTTWRLRTIPASKTGPKRQGISSMLMIPPDTSSTTHRHPEAKALVDGREEAKAKAEARSHVAIKSPTYKG